MEDVHIPRPVYANAVKITDWDLRRQAYPYDFCPDPKRSHYRTLGPTSAVYVPKTTTQESLEKGIGKDMPMPGGTTKRMPCRRPMTNFTSFPSLDRASRFASTEKPKTECDVIKSEGIIQKDMTTYKRSYIDHRPRPIKVPPKVPDISEAYPLFNKLSKNAFEMIGPLAPFKFMDDHLLNPTPEKKLSNYYKQIRMVSYNPWLGSYR